MKTQPALVKNNKILTSIDFQSNIQFNEQEQKWFIANFYVFLNYHSTNEFPINLENIFKLLGFANKKNAKRTLENNFTIDEDYKITVLPTEHGQFPRENVLLNVDTFKSLCMIVKSEKSKEIRKYYIKLENIYNKLINEERIEYAKKIEDSKKELEKQQKKIEEKNQLLIKQELSNIKEKEQILLKSYDKKCIVYLILIKENLFKFGFTNNITQRT